MVDKTKGKGINLFILIALIQTCNTLADGNSQCCDNCVHRGGILDCTQACHSKSLCEIPNGTTLLIFDNNTIGSDQEITFPFSQSVRQLSMKHNGLRKLPLEIFTAFPSLLLLELNGNYLWQFDLSQIQDTDIKRITGLNSQEYSAGTLSHFPKLKELEVTVHDDSQCIHVLQNNLETLKLNLPNTESLTRFGNLNQFQGINQGTIKKLTLNIPMIKQLKQAAFARFEGLVELTIIANQLERIHEAIFERMKNLQKIKLVAPKLTSYKEKLFSKRVNNVDSVMNYIELCPVPIIPNDLLSDQPYIKGIKICNIDNSQTIRIPIYIDYDKIQLSNLKFMTIIRNVGHSTIAKMKRNNERTYEHRLKVREVHMINASINTMEWRMLFEDEEIRTLNLGHNLLPVLNTEALEGMKNLRNLQLGHNKISHVDPTAFRNLNNLQIINLENNYLTQFAFYALPTSNIESIDLAHNRLDRIFPSDRTVKINNLNLKFNRITQTEVLFTHYMKIKRVSLRYNQIQTLPTDFHLDTEKADFNKNPLKCECPMIEHVRPLLIELQMRGQLNLVKDINILVCYVKGREQSMMQTLNGCAGINNTLSDINELFGPEAKIAPLKSKTNDYLLPSLGVLMQHSGTIASSHSLFTISLAIQLPDNDLPAIKNETQVKNICEQTTDEFVKLICPKHEISIKKKMTLAKRYREVAISKIKELHTIAYTEDQRTQIKYRRKRFAFSTAFQVVSGIAFGIGKIYSEFSTKRRLKDLTLALNAVRDRQIFNTNDIKHLATELSLIKSSSDKRIQEIANRVNENTEHFNDLAGRLSSYTEQLQQITELNEKRTRTLALLQEIRIETLDSLEQQITIYKTLVENINRLITNIIKLRTQGKITPDIVGYTELQGILNKAITQVEQKRPRSTIVFQKASSYYGLNNIGFAAGKDIGIILQIPIFLNMKDTSFLSLYRIQTLPVPFKVAENEYQYTRLKIENQYLARNENHYKVFSREEIDLCIKSRDVRLCPYTLTLIPKTDTSSCESSLMFNPDKTEVFKNCRTEVENKGLLKQANAITFDNMLLLTNMNPPIRFNCQPDTDNINITHKLHYAIIKTQDVCHCTITDRRENIILPHSDNCENSNNTTKVHYIINSMAYEAYKEILNLNLSENFISELHDTPSKLQYPKLEIPRMEKFQFKHAAHVFDLKSIISRKNEIADKPSLADELHDVEKLFTKYTIIGVTVATTTLLIILFIIMAIVIRSKYKNLKTFMDAFFMALLPTAQAKPIIEVTTWTDYWLSLTAMIGSLLAIQLSYTIFKIILAYLRDRTPALKTEKVLRNGERTRLCLELKTATKRIILQLYELHCGPGDIGTNQIFNIMEINIIKKYLMRYMYIQWNKDQDSFTLYDEIENLPTQIAINWADAKTINEIISNQNYIATLLTVDKYNQIRIVMKKLIRTDNEPIIIPTAPNWPGDSLMENLALPKEELKAQKKRLLKQMNTKI